MKPFRLTKTGESPGPRARRRPLALLLCLAAAAGPVLSAPPVPGLRETWHSDFDKAIAVARESGKENLLVFTGLEWEGRSRGFRDKVMGDPGFIRAVGKRFVLAHIDLPETPRDVKDLTGVEARGYRLARGLKLRGFPAVYLCSSDGRPYAMLAQSAEEPAAFARLIDGKRTEHAEAMRAIGRLSGPDRAIAIDAWLDSIPGPLRMLHRDKIEDLIAADPENVTGLRSEHHLALMIPEARSLRYGGKLEEAEALYLRIVGEAEPEGEALQQVYYELADVYFQRKDYDCLLETLDLAIEAAPRGERMGVLREMMQVFTRQWIFMKCKPAEMQAAKYDHRKVGIAPGDAEILLQAIAAARRVAPRSTRNRTLDVMARELGDANEGR